MTRSPSAFSSHAPSPRAPSVIRSPLPASVVGWYWIISMSIRRAPIRYARAIPLPAPGAGHDQPVRGRLVDLAGAAGGEDRALGVEHLEPAVAKVAADRAD